MPRFCANLSLLFTELEFPERFEAAARAGFTAVECQFPYAWPASTIAECLQRNRLEMVLINVPAGNWEAGDRGIAVAPDRVAEFRAGVDRAIAYAQALDCAQCNALAGVPAAGVDARTAEHTLITNLRYAAERFSAAGLQLLIEPLNTHDVPGFFLTRAQQALALIEQVDADNLYLQFDIYHAVRMGDDPVAIIGSSLTRIAHMQIADVPGRHQPGSGTIDFRRLFDHIDQLGYRGRIGAEYIPSQRTERASRGFMPKAHVARISVVQAETFLRFLFDAFVAAAQPARVLAAHLPEDRSAPLIVIGAGKAAAAMAAALESAWQGPVSGLVVTRYGHGAACRHIEVIEAAHPLPDAAGEQAARRILARVSNLRSHDRVICLLSGGGSALLALPAPGITLAQKRRISAALLASGAAIDDINRVRKHLSAIKGGRLAAACTPAPLLTLAISDVPGDDPAVIASGPTVCDETTSAEALSILRRHHIETPAEVEAWLANPASESIKCGDARLAHCTYRLIATPAQSLAAAAGAARHAGIAVLELGADIQGEARTVAQAHAALALRMQAHADPLPPPCVIVSGGETTVSVRGNGRGGRNGEYLLALAVALRGAPGIYAMACDSDGIDGSQDNAGALLLPEHWSRARALGIDPQALLENNDSYTLFSALRSLVITGPTRTNVNDFRALLVLPATAADATSTLPR